MFSSYSQHVLKLVKLLSEGIIVRPTPRHVRRQVVDFQPKKGRLGVRVVSSSRFPPEVVPIHQLVVQRRAPVSACEPRCFVAVRIRLVQRICDS